MPNRVIQGALATDQSVINAAHSAALQRLADPKTFNSLIAFSMLNTLAGASPIIRTKLGDLYQADPEQIDLAQILQNRTNVVRLQRICQELAQADAAQQLQMQQDLQQLKTDALVKSKEEENHDKNALKTYIENARKPKTSQQQQAIKDESVHTVDKRHAASRDKGLFDPLSALGILFELWLQMGFIVPVDQEFYAKGFKFAAPEEDAYLEQQRKEYGGDNFVLPTAAPALKA